MRMVNKLCAEEGFGSRRGEKKTKKQNKKKHKRAIDG